MAKSRRDYVHRQCWRYLEVSEEPQEAKDKVVKNVTV